MCIKQSFSFLDINFRWYLIVSSPKWNCSVLWDPTMLQSNQKRCSETVMNHWSSLTGLLTAFTCQSYPAGGVWLDEILSAGMFRMSPVEDAGWIFQHGICFMWWGESDCLFVISITPPISWWRLWKPISLWFEFHELDIKWIPEWKYFPVTHLLHPVFHHNTPCSMNVLCFQTRHAPPAHCNHKAESHLRLGVSPHARH